MSDESPNDTQHEVLVYATPVRAHLTLDPSWGQLTVIRFGSVWDGQPNGCIRQFGGDERLCFLFEEPGGAPIGFKVEDPHDFDPEKSSSALIWEGPRFEVPVLGLTSAAIGEIVLAVQGRFGEDEPTNDAMFFHMAINAAHDEDDLEKAAWCWRMALEAGDQKARFGLGYTLVELGLCREGYEHLRIYTELTPHNSWAWVWLGKACEGLDERGEAERAYRRAIECEERCGFETDAEELLRELER